MTYQELLRNIDKGSIASSYIFSGKEDSLKMDAVLRIRDKTGARVVFDESQQEDVFCEKKVVVLRNSKIMPKNTPSSIYILFVEKGDFSQTQSVIVSFPKLYGASLKSWIMERFKERQRSITEPAIELLITSTGGEVSFLISEIEKITIFSDKKLLDKDDISPVLFKHFNGGIFSLLDAIGGRKKEALSICSSLISYGASPSYILFMIERAIFEIFSLKDGCPDKIEPWKYRKLSSYERLFSKDKMYSIFSKLSSCDIKLKSYSSSSRPIILLSLIYHLIND